MRALNLGCGSRFHPDWENVDIAASGPNVLAHDLRKGIPFSNNSFDAVYHSHVLEHFPKALAAGFLRECHRVLKQGGIIRVAVPDLEQIARTYLDALDKAQRGIEGWDKNHEWMVLELYDQVVREKAGGASGEYFRQEPFPNWDFVSSRIGAEADDAVKFYRNGSSRNGGATFSSKVDFALHHFDEVTRNKVARVVLSKEDYEILQIGRFRKHGEVHHWMYDAYSLAGLLKTAGFRDPQRRKADESRIPNWTQFSLDTDASGKPFKPDSLYMEAIKP